MHVIVLGAGLVGRPLAANLAQNTELTVSVADVDSAALDRFAPDSEVQTIKADLSQAEEIKRVTADADLVINALPGFLGFNALEEIISAGKNVVDIAFSEQNPLQLDALAKERDVTAIVDCGVAPGMSNLLVGYADAMLQKTEFVEILVGGLPRVRTLPYEYKAVFSPLDVLEEYTRPARLVEGGKVVVKPALSDVEEIDFPGIGTLEAFNSDGLRTLIETIPAANMREKTLRYPGHAQKIKLLRDTGFLNKEPIRINGQKIRPIDLAAKLLFPLWQLQPGEEDITVMRVTVEGISDGKRMRYSWHLFDQYDSKTQVHSMARTTGYTAVMAAYLLLEGKFKQKGIIPPEKIGYCTSCVSFILKGLEDRGVRYEFRKEEIDIK